MSRAGASVLSGLGFVLVVGAAGCSSSRPPAAVPTGPRPSATVTTATPSAEAAGRALAAVQDELRGRSTIRIRTSSAGSGGAGTSVVTADLRSGDFRAEVDLGPGNGSLAMLRIGDTAWTRAPAEVWVGFGYTRSSARQAVGRWVVARVDSIKELVASLDPVPTVTGLAGLDPTSAVDRSRVRSGPLRGLVALRVAVGTATRTLFTTPGPDPRLVRIRALVDGVRTDYELLPAPSRLGIRVPDASDVLQR